MTVLTHHSRSGRDSVKDATAGCDGHLGGDETCSPQHMGSFHTPRLLDWSSGEHVETDEIDYAREREIGTETETETGSETETKTATEAGHHQGRRLRLRQTDRRRLI